MGKSTNKQPSAVGSPISIDNDGDLILRVGGAATLKEPNKTVECKVDSTTLRRASPVFKALLFSPRVETKVKPLLSDTEPWTVSLPEDEPGPFTILMGLAHAKYKFISRPWNTVMVNGLLILADKYDMMHLLSLFTTSMREVISDEINIVTAPDIFMNLYSSWELGDEQSFAKALKTIILATSLDKDDMTELTYHGSKLTSQHHLGPADLLDYIAEVRLSILTTLVDFINNEYKHCMTGNACGVSAPQPVYFSRQRAANQLQIDEHTRFKKICEDSNFGGFHRYFTACEDIPFFPINVGNIHHSFTEFRDSTMKLLQQMQSLSGHEQCSPSNRFQYHYQGLLDGTTSKRWEPENLIKQEHKEIMKKKREAFNSVV
ncbi:hypothetical protein B0T21DRAFT_421629 [Apiosordaria backusii]|uniref:BTB domain-containing protein n=1 Tax=Apiosordaria backusii TaxID=314023 RepID=A0AA40B285_9PEZI|nr:hypothetical protein B0T21DRAFT_421629 [Apiosordaria backusii]